MDIENINIGDFLFKIADFLGKLGDFIYNILFHNFNFLGLQVNMFTLLFVVGVPIWISIIILKNIIRG